jgi:hypothetical protein
MTWLKKRIKELGLARKGPAVQYSAISDVQAAIEVYACTQHCTLTIFHLKLTYDYVSLRLKHYNMVLVKQ